MQRNDQARHSQADGTMISDCIIWLHVHKHNGRQSAGLEA